VNPNGGRASLARRVRALVERARVEYAGHEAATATLDALAVRLDEPLRVAIAGRVKSGKSTLLNALVGEPLAAMEVGECTKVVTWYRHGRTYGAFIQRRGDSRLEPTGLRRLGGAVDVEPGEWTAAELDRIVIEWPAAALAQTTFIDTPGLGSLSAEAGERTSAFLVPEAESSPADAVVYLARHLHGSDVRILEAFRDDDAGRPNPINAIAVVARADEIGVARVDAMAAATRVAERYRRDPQLRRLCQTVVPVAGLLALGAAQITESDFQALRGLAEADDGLAEDLLLSTDRFTAEDHDVDDAVPVPAVDDRRRLLDRLGLFGVRLSRALLRERAAATSQELAHELRRRSGIDELRTLLATQFAARSHILKARVGLAVLDRLTRRFPLDDGDALAAELERVEADAHELAEVRLLVAVRTGGVEFHDDEVAEVERLVERAGLSLVERLGLDAETPDEEISHAVQTRVEHWRRRAAHPLAPRATVDAAGIVMRSYEGMLLELPSS
jgi:energy-coupling factor transporter ATP-binding protein EcfA2